MVQHICTFKFAGKQSILLVRKFGANKDTKDTDTFGWGEKFSSTDKEAKVAVRSAARLKGDRLGILLSGSRDGVTPAARRQEAQRQHAGAHKEYAAMYGSGPPQAR